MPTAPEIFPTAILLRGFLEASGVAAVFRVPVGDFQAEGDGLGVHAVRAADFGRVLEFPGALFENFAEARDAFFDQTRSFADQEGLRGVHHVIGGEAVVQPARRFGIADRFLHDDGEGDHVMAYFGFDFVDAGDIDAGALAQLCGGFARNDARFGERFGGGQLNIQPVLEFVFFAPDAAHFRARVSCDQDFLPGMMRLRRRTFCALPQ